MQRQSYDKFKMKQVKVYGFSFVYAGFIHKKKTPTQTNVRPTKW